MWLKVLILSNFMHLIDSVVFSGVLPKKEVGGRSLFKFSIFLENIGENGPQ